MFKLTRKRGVILGVIVAVAVAATAVAYWTSSGSGSGTATTGSSQAVTFTQGAAPAGLVPGGDPKDIAFSIDNPATNKQYIASVTVSIPTTFSAKADTTKPACTKDDFDITGSWTAKQIDPGATQVTGFKIALKNTDANQDNCQGVTVPLSFSAS